MPCNRAEQQPGQLTDRQCSLLQKRHRHSICPIKDTLPLWLVDALGLSWTAAVVNPGLVLHPPPKDCSRQSALSIPLRADFQKRRELTGTCSEPRYSAAMTTARTRVTYGPTMACTKAISVPGLGRQLAPWKVWCSDSMTSCPRLEVAAADVWRIPEKLQQVFAEYLRSPEPEVSEPDPKIKSASRVAEVGSAGRPSPSRTLLIQTLLT